MKEEGTPLRIVAERNRETKKVMQIPSKITKNTTSADMVGRNHRAQPPPTKIVAMMIIVGKRPLHGTKLFVSTAISRSRGESIMLVPVTPPALQPKPMHLVGLQKAIHCYALVLQAFP